MQAIAGLTAGIKWLNQQGWEQLLNQRHALTEKMRDGLMRLPGITTIGSTKHSSFTGAVSITSSALPLKELKETLAEKYQIRGSYGFQCAPLAHEAVGTEDTGTLRFSVGPMSALADVDALLTALEATLIH